MVPNAFRATRGPAEQRVPVQSAGELDPHRLNRSHVDLPSAPPNSFSRDLEHAHGAIFERLRAPKPFPRPLGRLLGEMRQALR